MRRRLVGVLLVVALALTGCSSGPKSFAEIFGDRLGRTRVVGAAAIIEVKGGATDSELIASLLIASAKAPKETTVTVSVLDPSKDWALSELVWNRSQRSLALSEGWGGGRMLEDSPSGSSTDEVTVWVVGSIADGVTKAYLQRQLKAGRRIDWQDGLGATGAPAVLRNADLMMFFAPVRKSAVPPSLGATEAAARIWGERRDDSALNMELPDVANVDGSKVAEPFRVVPTLEVESVVEIVGLDTGAKGGSLRDRMVSLDRYLVLLRKGPSVAAIMIGRTDTGWLYSPSTSVGTSDLLKASALAPNDRVLLATVRGSTHTWWLFGTTTAGKDVAVRFPQAPEEQVTPAEPGAITQDGPTIFMGTKR